MGRVPVLLLSLLLLSSPGLFAQERLAVSRLSGIPSPAIALVTHEGFAAFEARELEKLGWTVEEGDWGVRATYRLGGPNVEFRLDTPFLRWGNDGVQLAQAPYLESGRVHLPIQFLVDILPWKLPKEFRYGAGSWVLEVLDALPPKDLTRVVVIDAGHGGRDPGSTGRNGTREKDIVLRIAEALAEILKGAENLEVYLTRDSDVLIPIWQRGTLATEWKGGGHGVFISIHANAVPGAVPGSEATRGFETYFLSEARTDHERRVAELENSAVELEGAGDQNPAGDPDLGFILTELRNLDHAHWSSLLADFIQTEVAQLHPGRDRGVKQGPLAVLTNSLMPAVLFEVGFLSNVEEERLLNERSFQEDIAGSLARAVLEFFRRYPPGGEWKGS